MSITEHLQTSNKPIHMSVNQETSERKCLWCKSLIDSRSRSDKKFCNTACKSHYNRSFLLASEIPPELPPLSAHVTLIAQALFTYDSGHVLMLSYMEDEFDENNNAIEGSIIEVPRNESYKYYLKVRHHQEKTDPLHAQYADVVESYLDNTYDFPDIKLLDTFIKNVAEAINAYVQHVGLGTPGHIAHYRLSNLYLIYHHLQSQRSHLIGCYSRGELPFIECIGGYLSNRHQSYLWGNLLGID